MKIATIFVPLISIAACAQQASPSPSPSSGRELFIAYCGPCHGLDGKGNGPAATAFRKPPADLTLLAQRKHGKFPGAEVAHELHDVRDAPHGSKEMPVWGPILSELSPKGDEMAALRISNIVSYIETLQIK